MTLIDIKGSKQSGPADSRNRYDFEGGLPMSGTPLYVGFMITALTLYFKSVYGSWFAEEAPRSHHAPQQDENHAPAEHLSAEASPAPEAEPIAPPDNSNVVDRKFLLARIAKIKSEVTSTEHLGLSLSDPGSIDYSGLQLDSPLASNMISVGMAVSFPVQSSNDNRRAAAPPTIQGDSGAPEGNQKIAEFHGPDPLLGQAAANGKTAGDQTTGPANRRPVVSGPVALYDQFAFTAILIALTDLIRNASDPDGDTLAITNLTASSGTLTLTDAGYSFSAATAGPVTLTYQITDGELSIEQTATFTVREPAESAAAGDISTARLAEAATDGVAADTDDAATAEVAAANGEVITGSDQDDVLTGGAGDDHIDGGAGNDIIRGGAGNDIIVGGSGDDALYGEEGNDQLNGGAGNDRIAGGAGNDHLYGETGDDYLAGGEGADLVDAGSGNDTVAGAIDGSTDVLDGGEGFDILTYGTTTSDLLFDIGLGRVEAKSEGGIESDSYRNFETFAGGAGNDVFEAVAVRSTAAVAPIVETATTADQTFVGGAGIDTLDYGAATEDIVIDVAAGTAAGAEIGTDSFEDIETFAGGAGNDVFAAVAARAAAAPIVETATTPDQTFVGGAGIDTLDYGAAAEDIVIDVAAGTAMGAEIGTDSFEDIETFAGGAGNDVFAAVAAPQVSGLPESESLEAPVIASPLGSAIDLINAFADEIQAAVEDFKDDAGMIVPDNTFIGGGGTDMLDYGSATESIVVDLTSSMAAGASIGADSFDSIETFAGGSGNDIFVAGPSAEIAQVFSALDSLLDAVKSASAEIKENSVTDSQTFVGGAGVDSLVYDGAAAAISFDLAAGTASGSEIGTDHFAQIEILVGGSGDDSFEVGGATALPAASEPSIVMLDQAFAGGDGIDTLSYAGASSDLVIDTVAGTAVGSDIGSDQFESMESIVGGAGNDTIIVGVGVVSVDGHSGSDMFVFLSDGAVGSSSGKDNDCNIKNFEVGDVVRMSKWDIFDAVVDQIHDVFEDIYGDDHSGSGSGGAMDVDHIPIQIRYEMSDDFWRTMIDADLDNDSIYELTVMLDGHHELTITTNLHGNG